MERARIFGRIVRLAVAGLLIGTVVAVARRASTELLFAALGVFAGLVMFYSAVHYLVGRFVPRLNRWLGALIANLPVIVVFLLGLPGGAIFGSGEGQLAALAYLGLALLVAGLRADAGCEVMSIPGLIFGRRTHLACLVFSPVDWLERRVAGPDGRQASG